MTWNRHHTEHEQSRRILPSAAWDAVAPVTTRAVRPAFRPPARATPLAEAPQAAVLATACTHGPEADQHLWVSKTQHAEMHC